MPGSKSGIIFMVMYLYVFSSTLGRYGADRMHFSMCVRRCVGESLTLSLVVEFPVCKITKTNWIYISTNTQRCIFTLMLLALSFTLSTISMASNFISFGLHEKYLIHHFTAVAKQTENNMVYETLRIWKMYLNKLYLFVESTTKLNNNKKEHTPRKFIYGNIICCFMAE